jgi:hypothetical protein
VIDAPRDLDVLQAPEAGFQVGAHLVSS